MAKMSQTVGITAVHLFLLTFAWYVHRQLYKNIHSVRYLAIRVKFCCVIIAWVLIPAEKLPSKCLLFCFKANS
jgi:hypothetical protein